MLNLHNEDSDYDRLHVFVGPTEEILSFGIKRERTALVVKDDEQNIDYTYWELGKAVDLLCKGNFNALPLVYPHNPDIEILEYPMGDLFVACQDAFLSENFIQSVIGYGYSKVNGHMRSPKEWASIATAIETVTTLLLGESESRRENVRKVCEWARSKTVIPNVLPLEEKLYGLKQLLESGTCLPAKPDYDRIKKMMVSIRQLALEGEQGEHIQNNLIL